jgi:calcineurin-like phosphoesterase family protein
MNIWLTSDTHFSHRNIIKYCPKTRGQFVEPDGSPALYQMNQTMVDEWNSKVQSDDLVYFLGDWSLNPNVRDEWVSNLNGKIVWIRGNHDSKFDRSKHLFEAAHKHSTIVTHDGKTIYLVHSPYDAHLAPDYVDFVVCGHVHDLWQYKKKGSFVSAYITKEHQEEGFTSRHDIINVGLDAWDFRMLSLKEVLALALVLEGETDG